MKLLLFLATTLALQAASVTVPPIFPNQKIKLPVALAIPPDDSNRLFLVQQHGLITILPNDRLSPTETIFLDHTSRPLIDNQFEEGLLGLRNPWGMTFHPKTNELRLADVGQNQFEEINIITKGGNYGWSFHEGFHPKTVRTDDPPKDLKFIDPIHEYPRTDGISITGGLHYQGTAVPALKGKYLYGDWGLGTLWALDYQDGKVVENQKIYARPDDSLFRPTAFVTDASGELLILSHDHKIYTISPDPQE